MAYIELVIKIPEEYYNYIKNISAYHCTGDMLIIKNGTPLKAIEQRPKSEWQQDHEILKAYSDGANAVLDKIRAEIDEKYDRVHPYDISCAEGLEMALNIVDKYIAEEDKA